MLKINKKLKYSIFAIIFALGGLFLFQYLTFVPEYSHADSISTTNPIKTLADISTMQEMTPEICANTPESTATEDHQKQLIDSRDGKTYWVAKLKDGNCWMTQNLSLDLKNGEKLTSMKSDVADWNPGASTLIVLDGSNWADGSEEKHGNIVNSYNPGNTFCNMAGCSLTNSMNGGHDAQGNYYTYVAATAGSTVISGNAEQSICPKGWQLPISNSADDKSFGRLLDGITASSSLLSAPYYLTYSGVVSNTLVGQGSYGYYWSSTSFSTTGAYTLSIDKDNIRPSYGFYNIRFRGNSVRCVNKGANPTTPVTPDPSEIDNPSVSVTVPNIITLDVSDSVDIATETNKVNTGEFTATVSSNKDYTVSLNAASDASDATALVNYKNDNKVGEIPTIVENAQLTAGISSWGIMLCNNTTKESCTNNYLPLPKKDATDSIFLNNGTKGTHQHLFQIGIGIGPELPSGTYTTSIQVTASQK